MLKASAVFYTLPVPTDLLAALLKKEKQRLLNATLRAAFPFGPQAAVSNREGLFLRLRWSAGRSIDKNLGGLIGLWTFNNLFVAVTARHWPKNEKPYRYHGP